MANIQSKIVQWRWSQPLSKITHCLKKKYGSSQFNLFYAIATPCHSNLRLLLVVNQIKYKCGNNSRLKSRWSFSLSRIICRHPLIQKYPFLYIHRALETFGIDDTLVFCLFSKRQLPKIGYDKCFQINNFFVRNCSTKEVLLKFLQNYQGNTNVRFSFQ